MGRQIIEQPDGKFCVFSTVIDGFILTDATREDIETLHVEEAAEDAIKRVGIIFDKLKKNERPYYQFGISYEDALEMHKKHFPEDK